MYDILRTNDDYKTDRELGLNKKHLLSAVYVADYTRNSFSPEIKQRYFDTTRHVFEDIAAIKDNPSYCSFVSEEIGYNLAAGFDNLQEVTLHLDADNETRNFSDRIVFSHQNTASLILSGKSLEERSPQNLNAIVSHEMGHLMLYSVLDVKLPSDPYMNVKTFNSGYCKDYNKNWEIELAADKIAIAANPQNNIGKLLAENNLSRNWINNNYQAGYISPAIARTMAKFCKARDEMILKKTGPYESELINEINKNFRMNCQPTHPADIVRAIEGEKFAEKAKKFLAQQKH